MDQSLMGKILEGLRITAEAAGFGQPRNLPEVIGSIIGIALSFLGIVFLILIIYAGFTWMTSAGNERKVLEAKKTLINSTIGLAIVLSAYAITSFIIQSLRATTGAG
jgi:TRAP-type C4-dicarboxylate transport system permease small subunit